MSHGTIESRVRAALSELNSDFADEKPERPLRELIYDSLDSVEAMMALEEEFVHDIKGEITEETEAFAGFTLADLVTYVEKSDEAGKWLPVLGTEGGAK